MKTTQFLKGQRLERVLRSGEHLHDEQALELTNHEGNADCSEMSPPAPASGAAGGLEHWDRV